MDPPPKPFQMPSADMRANRGSQRPLARAWQEKNPSLRECPAPQRAQVPAAPAAVCAEPLGRPCPASAGLDPTSAPADGLPALLRERAIAARPAQSASDDLEVLGYLAPTALALLVRWLLLTCCGTHVKVQYRTESVR
eukprot:12412036-Karenia_brevis.AAC.1